MEGPNIHDTDYRGVLPRAIEKVMALVENPPSGTTVSVGVSHIEIYLERVQDLLQMDKANLAVREDTGKGLWVTDATEIQVTSTEEAIGVLQKGTRNRATAATSMNEASSRSHAIFVVSLRTMSHSTCRAKTSQLYLVDLAGSEAVSKSEVAGKNLTEAKMINTSLLSLSQVITALAAKAKEKKMRRPKTAKTSKAGTRRGSASGGGGGGGGGKKTHIPYRNSKLTRFLQNSFGGNSRTALVVTISPSSCHDRESLSSLRFGELSGTIKNKPRVNQGVSMQELKAQLTASEAEIGRLKVLNRQLEGEILHSRKVGSIHKQLRLTSGGGSKGGVFSFRDEARFRRDGLGHFLCPLSGRIMANAVLATDGYTYEEAAMVEFFAENGYQPRSPVTGMLLANTQLIANHTLRSAVLQHAGRAATVMWLPDHIMHLVAMKIGGRHLAMMCATCQDLQVLTSEPELWLYALEDEGLCRLEQVDEKGARAAYYKHGWDVWRRPGKPPSNRSLGLRLHRAVP